METIHLKTQSHTYSPPESVRDAEERRRVLEGEALAIQNQLQYFQSIWEDDRVDPNAPLPDWVNQKIESYDNFVDWRFRAQKALVWKTDEVGFLTDWIAREEVRLLTAYLGIDEHTENEERDILERITSLMESLLRKHRVELHKDEAALVEYARLFVRSNPTTATETKK